MCLHRIRVVVILHKIDGIVRRSYGLRLLLANSIQRMVQALLTIARLFLPVVIAK